MTPKIQSNAKTGFKFSCKSIGILLIYLVVSTFSLSLHIHNNQHQSVQNSIHNLGREKKMHHQQNVYDQGEYLAKLAGIQNTFKQQILDIQSDFVSINSMLNDSNLDDGQKKIKIQQALADERDSLRDIQNSLKIPYALKSCQCIDLNQQQKKQIQAKLDAVGKKINDLQKQSKSALQGCQDQKKCPLTKEFNEQIKIMINYQTIMLNTISSQCCKVVKRAYKDNLDSNNWHFGSTTQQDYQATLFKRQQIQKVSLVPCSYMAPFVDVNNSCFSCPDTKPLFNLGSRKCQKDCSQFGDNQAFVLNLTTHICGYNKNCPSKQYFDTSLLKCITTPNYYNDSSCPPQKPFWDPKSLSCSFCLSQTPYYDIILKKCRSCYQNETWSQAKNICQGQVKCAFDQIYNVAINQCTKKDTSSSHSLCPPDRPFWDQVNYSCDTCPKNKPFFDTKLSYCRNCTLNQTFNDFSKLCQPTTNVSCLKGEYYSIQTKKCQKTGTTSMCPPSTPFWDSQNYKCLKCPPKTPLFNQQTRKCQECPINKTWSQNQQACTTVCALDQSWDSQYKKCLKKNRLCQPMQLFNINLNKCVQVNCAIDKPFWNVTAQECQVCPSNTLYNIQANICQKDNRYGNVSVCQADSPVWNSQILRCESCPSGTTWNSIQSQCISSKSHLKNSQLHLNSIQVHKEIYGHVYGNQRISYQHKNLPLSSGIN